MFRGDTLLILGHGVKSPGQLWPLALRCLVTRFRKNTAAFYDKLIFFNFALNILARICVETMHCIQRKTETFVKTLPSPLFYEIVLKALIAY